MSTSEGRAPPIIAHARDLLSRYEVVYSDVWGVLHDGYRAFGAACDALVRFRQIGGTVILVSNAPVPRERVAHMLDARRVPRDAWDFIVSSGEIALTHLQGKAYRGVHYVGPLDRDASFFDRADAPSVSIAEAEAIVCTGLRDDMTETAEDYRMLLADALDRKLPFVCVNPDLVVDVGGRLFPCAGAIAEIYQHMGGEVFWAGKPYAAAYDAARSAAQGIRGRTVSSDKVLVIGDALRTDIAGAAAQGLDALFIGAGIHRHETMDGDQIAPHKLADLFGSSSPRAIGAMPVLSW